MSEAIEVDRQTKTEQLIASLGWSTRPSGSGENLAVETCPFCRNTNWKFFVNIGDDKDGLYFCQVCGEKGNYFSLRASLGVRTLNVVSTKDMASSGAPSPLPNLENMHRQLLENEAFGEVLDYVVATRGFSIDTIKKLKLGAEHYDGQDWLVYPYLDAAGKAVYYKARSLPPAKKAFRAPAGREAMLYNEQCLKPGMTELVMAEGEADAVALINQGLTNVVGIPGAGVKKAAWIERLDRCAPASIFLVYDADKVGQDAAKEMAQRIGVDKVRNVVIPKYEENPVKDVNEFFTSGRTIEEFRQLMSEAKLVDVEGVQSVSDILDELQTALEENGAEPAYLTPWPSLTKRLGGCEDGDVIGVMAEGKVGKTTVGLNWCQWSAANGGAAMLYCLEMLPVRLVRKWTSHVTQTPDTPGASQMTPATVAAAKIVAQQMQGDLLFGYGKSRKPDDVFNTIRQAVRRYGVKLVCLDNLQLLIHGVKDTAQETSKVIKQFKALMMELKVVGLLIIQPNRVAEGTIVAARNAMGSSAIEKDVDAMICLHRNRTALMKASDFHGFLETDEGMEPHLLTRVDLSRYSAGGVCTLMIDGATSTVREITQDEASSTIGPVSKGAIPIEQVQEI